jgi:hypothetical protein
VSVSTLRTQQNATTEFGLGSLAAGKPLQGMARLRFCGNRIERQADVPLAATLDVHDREFTRANLVAPSLLGVYNYSDLCKKSFTKLEIPTLLTPTEE